MDVGLVLLKLLLITKSPNLAPKRLGVKQLSHNKDTKNIHRNCNHY